jgi:hypothetical protein
MSKQLKQNKNRNSRKKRGGSGEKMLFLASLKANTQMILADIERMEDELPEGAPDENCDLSEIKKNAIQAKVLIKNLIEEEQNQPEEREEQQEVKNPLDQVITTNGFTGTIGELLSKLREKIEQLNQYNNAGHEQTIAHLKTLLDSVSSESTNVNKIKEMLKGGRIKFKKNKVVITKRKKRRNKSDETKKQKKQTKRRYD